MAIDKWSANEGTNVGLGQVGSIFTDDNANTFPTGMVIFGHWGRVQMATGTAILYLGGYNS